MSSKIIIVAGDPNSINSEIIYKSFTKTNIKQKKQLYLIANFDLIVKQFNKLKFKRKIIQVKDINDYSSSIDLKILDVPLKFKNPFNVSLNNASKYLLDCLNKAHKLAKYKNVKGIINCPIDKKLIVKFKKKGITEFLATKCGIKDNSEIMMIHNKKFSVVPLTTHLNIRDVSRQITSKFIIKKINSLNFNFKKIFKKKPKIGILGLNPHNGEMKNNSEEKLEIYPAISLLRNRNLNVEGPLVADTIFIKDYKKFDVIVGMYHDQVLAPFKTLFHFNAINLTLGLSYVRVSPDHGPATNLIGKNKANYLSLLECIKFIYNLKK